MATIAPTRAPFAKGETRFFVIMAFVMSGLIVSGFALNLALGRSSFALPWPYHVHGVIFMGWITLYLAQHITVATGQRAAHIALGRLAFVWIPAMVMAGGFIIYTSLRLNGGPFFFALNEFLISNFSGLLCFGALGYWALLRRRHTGWHRRLMLVAMSVLTGPGIGRMLPAPLMIPYAWEAIFLVTLVFPAIAMIADKRRDGRVHPALWWGTGVYVASFAASMALAYSPVGYAITAKVVAGTEGENRPMEAYLPPDFGH